jgi:crotonobetainyl-CoA:carnitine CoA-transferase CaiB-like acyl-CoA transferase
MMPLEGIRVVETGGFMAAPLAARHLADMGADVIKLEHPVRGEPARGITLLRERYTGGFLEVFEVCNRNKRSVGIDLQNPLGKEVIHKLIKTADVFITNFQEKTLVKMELDYDTLSRLNPRLVYGIGTGWGRKGSDKGRPAFDLAAFAMTGAMSQMAWAEQPPVPLGVVGMGDEINGLMLALSVMYALFTREKTGVGQMAHASLVGSWVEACGSMFQHALFHKKDVPNQRREAATSPLWNCYATRDARYIQLAIIQSDPYWHDLCEALEIPEIEDSPPFDNHWGRVENNTELIAIFDKAFEKRTLVEWVERFKNYRVIWAPVLSFLEASRDPLLKENDYIIQVEHPNYGRLETVGIPTQLEKTPGEFRFTAPALGQHTEEVLLEMGYTWADIKNLKKEKAVI